MYTHLEDYIRELYHSIGITKPEQIDMHYIAARLNVDITYQERVFCLGNEIILKRTNKVQEWLDFGHELCHVLRHRGSQVNMYPLYVELQEWKAESFMYHFCVPTFMLEKLVLPRTRNEAIGKIARVFSVSHEFAEQRLDKWISQREGIKFQKMFSSLLTRDAVIFSRS